MDCLFTVGKPVSMNDVPDPFSMRRTRGRYAELLEKIGQLPRGKALPISVPDIKAGVYIRSHLRSIAKKNGEFLSSSRSEDGKTFYFWIEPKESASK